MAHSISAFSTTPAERADIAKLLAPASLYFTALEPGSGKTTLALGVINVLASAGFRVGVFRPISPRNCDYHSDGQLAMLAEYTTIDQEISASIGVSSTEFGQDPIGAMGIILDKYSAMKNDCDWVIVLGGDYDDPHSTSELVINAKIAANLQSPLMISIQGAGKTTQEIKDISRAAIAEAQAQHATVAAVVINRVVPEHVQALQDTMEFSDVTHMVIPEEPVLLAPTVDELVHASAATLVFGEADGLSREISSVLLAGMGLDRVLSLLCEDALVIVPGDRSDIFIGVLAAHQSPDFPKLSGIILCGNVLPPEHVMTLAQNLSCGLPVFASALDCYEQATLASATHGHITSGSVVKVEKAIELVEKYMISDELITILRSNTPDVITPQLFEFQLLQQARSQRKHIILPEGTDDRILQSAAIIVARGIATLTILGDPQSVHHRAEQLGISLGNTAIVDPITSPWREEFAREYQRIRAHKGVTYEQAYDKIIDVSYFGTMMVHTGKADGMVSGAAHTTAHTIRPAFEIIKTKPGVSTVSSLFFMCLPDKILAFGDCAVVPDPTVDQLADIAISSAHTAAQFGLDPRIAMLSYSTGNSGSGADVDKVREAVHTVKRKEPELIVDGPIQFDAAVDPVVAKAKLPDSPVAGRATVLIFPDLNAGNNTYKAVQRTAGAVAIGPVLQGINKPVNDLSRGALINDIVNTIAITAIQAQSE